MTWAAILAAGLAAAGVTDTAALLLPVPVIRQAPERCGPAALAMVLRFYGADAASVAEAERAYDPALRGALITDLAAAARRAGYEAASTPLDEPGLRALLAAGVPPIVLFRRGSGPITRGHYSVVVGWDPARQRYALNDGRRAPIAMSRSDLMHRWRAAGSLALVVRRRP